MPTYFSRRVNLPFKDVLNKLIVTLKQHGFGILADVDMRHILKKNLNVDFRNYEVICAFVPKLAYGAISLESHTGMLLPCNIVIQEHENGEVEVSAFNLLESIEKELTITHLKEIMAEVTSRLRVAIDDLPRDSYQTTRADALPLENVTNNVPAPICG
jgi:uncharacterized protein (DUF302 family)